MTDHKQKQRGAAVISVQIPKTDRIETYLRVEAASGRDADLRAAFEELLADRNVHVLKRAEASFNEHAVKDAA
jgi:hypothetical protein